MTYKGLMASFTLHTRKWRNFRDLCDSDGKDTKVQSLFSSRRVRDLIFFCREYNLNVEMQRVYLNTWYRRKNTLINPTTPPKDQQMTVIVFNKDTKGWLNCDRVISGLTDCEMPVTFCDIKKITERWLKSKLNQIIIHNHSHYTKKITQK